MSEVTVSVIVPVYNLEREISRCLDSIIAQTHKDLQIIVIDDGSSDKSPEIIDAYAARDERIEVVHRENGGLVSARDCGISLSRGQYTGFVDGDDEINADMYERLLANAVKYGADISHCGVTFCLEDGTCEEHYGTGELLCFDRESGLRELLCGERIEPSLSNKIYRTELLRDSCLDSSVVNNEDLLRNFVLFSRAEKSVFEDFCGYRYIKRGCSMSNDSRAVRSARHVFRARKLIVENADDSVRPYAMRCFLNCVVNFVNSLAFSSDAEAADYCAECRSVLRSHGREIKYLIKRQRLAAWLIIVSPTLHRVAYGIYKRKQAK